MTFTEVRNEAILTSKRIGRLGARTLAGLVAALVAAILLFASPEIGIASAIGGVIVGASLPF